ncbi:hypothetical protein JQX13_12170 [Archangium violaceum]|uniref:DUF6232 family protein n=1 Tax=Archangium violaceum TaxID=83451 RepID=UPI00193B12ED|nr:DUF6232 family protein [Archangium violaceum]QRK10753.1 hypothetical protein JQX13_12170 [Archangium violaceum]
MMERETGLVAQSRARPVLRLVPALAPEPLTPSGERVLVSAEGFRLTSERLEAAGRSWRLEELRGFGTRHEAPGLKLPLSLGAGAALVVPALLLQPGSFRVTAALAVATVLVFSSIARLVMAADTYWLTVRTAEGERLVLCSHDHQLFARVVEALGEVLSPPEPRPVTPEPGMAVRRLALVR